MGPYRSLCVLKDFSEFYGYLWFDASLWILVGPYGFYPKDPLESIMILVFLWILVCPYWSL